MMANALWTSLAVALIVTCCRKSKNDISKLIFKSGDFQMSPYTDVPKNPRSQEWGREAIEMHENRCPVGYQLEKGICNLVRTFVTEFKLKKTFLNTTAENHSNTQELENEIAQTLNVCFSTLPGYIRTTAHVSREPSTVFISLKTTFALASNVTLFDLADRIQKYVNSCRSSAEVCQLLGSQRRVFRAGSLCKRKSPECDKETSICTDLDGVALCQCKSGYFQFNKMDHSCRACEDGYRLENETCMSCPFGLGGLNCGNPYQLITVVIAAAGGGLLLILGVALIVTCCRCV